MTVICKSKQFHIALLYLRIVAHRSHICTKGVYGWEELENKERLISVEVNDDTKRVITIDIPTNRKRPVSASVSGLTSCLVIPRKDLIRLPSLSISIAQEEVVEAFEHAALRSKPKHLALSALCPDEDSSFKWHDIKSEVYSDVGNCKVLVVAKATGPCGVEIPKIQYLPSLCPKRKGHAIFLRKVERGVSFNRQYYPRLSIRFVHKPFAFPITK